MIKAIDANMYLYLFVENIAPIQEIDTANCIHFKLNSVVLNISHLIAMLYIWVEPLGLSKAIPKNI